YCHTFCRHSRGTHYLPFTQILPTLATIQNPTASIGYFSSSQIFEDYLTDYLQMNEEVSSFLLSGKNASLYAEFRILQDPKKTTGNMLGHFKDTFRTKKGYAIGSLLSTAAPYLEVGTFWIYQDGRFMMYMEDSREYPTSVYAYLTWITI
ncbi:hypothetical protein, partial [uncultured Acetatifactor sp.]|uniref:hypothetical protein n=1 Tax=uncultured Acetatifactor sp. TaxID=1671927 RepID=UPI00262F2CC4